MKYFRLILIIAMALPTLRDLFKLTEEDATYNVLVTYVNSCGGSVT